MLRTTMLAVLISLLAGCAVYTEPGPYVYGPPRVSTYVVPAPVPVYPYPYRGWGGHRGWR